MFRIFAIAITLVLVGNAVAQISLIGSSNERLLVIRSLPVAGKKLWSQNSIGLNIYNLDLTPYITIAFPPEPPGFTYFSPVYFTENTFDTDPTTIEVMMLMVNMDGLPATRVIREEGTIVFEDLDHGISVAGGHDELNSSPTLFTGEDDITYMILGNWPLGSPLSTRLYQLPGILPCQDCSGVQVGMTGDNDQSSSDLVIFPNPTTGTVNVRYDLSGEKTSAILVIYDVQGKKVLEVDLDHSGTSSFSMAGHASGIYTCTLIVDRRVLGVRSLIMEH